MCELTMAQCRAFSWRLHNASGVVLVEALAVEPQLLPTCSSWGLLRQNPSDLPDNRCCLIQEALIH